MLTSPALPASSHPHHRHQKLVAIAILRQSLGAPSPSVPSRLRPLQKTKNRKSPTPLSKHALAPEAGVPTQLQDESRSPSRPPKPRTKSRRHLRRMAISRPRQPLHLLRHIGATCLGLRLHLASFQFIDIGEALYTATRYHGKSYMSRSASSLFDYIRLAQLPLLYIHGYWRP